MVRFIIWMIIAFIVVKFLSVALRAVRKFLQPGKFVHPSSQQKPQSYSDVQDVEYEEIKDKQK